MGYYFGVANPVKDPVDSLKSQVKTMTSTVIEKSSEFTHDLTLHHNLNRAKAMLLDAKKEIQKKNFGEAQDGVGKAIALLTETRAIPNTTEQIEKQIDNIHTRLLNIQDDVNDLKPSVIREIADLAEDIDQLRNTTPSL
ncbi:MAG: hypothetical protein CMH81_06410 [Nitrospiraceae bacterium]|nr:hypothetical protein [Nitrospiraceae bacterium]